MGDAFNEDQRAQTFLRLADGGLGLASAEAVVATAFLGSWALTLKGVASCLGETSWEGFRARCQPVAEAIDRAEAKLAEQVGGALSTDWVSFLAEPQAKR